MRSSLGSDNDEINKEEREPMRAPSSVAVAAIAGVISGTIYSKFRQSSMDERIENNKKKMQQVQFASNFFVSDVKAITTATHSGGVINDAEEEDRLLEDQVIAFIIEEEEKLLHQQGKKKESQKRKRGEQERVIDFWETSWGKLISHPDVDNPRRKQGKQFRRRFRIPYPLFHYVVDCCKRENIFNLKYQSKEIS